MAQSLRRRARLGLSTPHTMRMRSAVLVRLTACLCALLVVPSVSWAQSRAALIAEATVSLPEDEREGAAVVVVEADGTQRVLRGSTNGLLCRLQLGAGSFAQCHEAETHQLFLSAVNGVNHPVGDLRVDEVRIERAGGVCPVMSLALETDPMKVALLVDNSERAARTLNPLRTGLQHFLDTLPAAHEVGLFTISNQTRRRVEFTSDRDVLREAVGTLFVDRNTNAVLFDGLLETWDRWFSEEDEWPVFVLVLFDEGQDGPVYERTYNALVQGLLNRAGTVHAVRLTTRTLDRPVAATTPQGAIPIIAWSGVQSDISPQLTRDTGGIYLPIVAGNALPEALTELAVAMGEHYDEVTGRYRVVYECEPEDPNVATTLTVNVMRPALTIHAFPDRRRSSPNGVEGR